MKLDMDDAKYNAYHFLGWLTAVIAWVLILFLSAAGLYYFALGLGSLFL